MVLRIQLHVSHTRTLQLAASDSVLKISTKLRSQLFQLFFAIFTAFSRRRLAVKPLTALHLLLPGSFARLPSRHQHVQCPVKRKLDARDERATCSRAVTAFSSCLASRLDASLMSLLPACPLARPMTVSLVLVSPSTEICTQTDKQSGHP